MKRIGVMAMPADFRYRDVFLKGKPRHERYDTFRARHPSMDVGHRAKIFAPFDALTGFGDAVASKDIIYRERIELSEEKQAELNHRLGVLKSLTLNGRRVRADRVKITVTFYVPCSDENNEAYGLRGTYRKITGLCRGVDEYRGALTVDNMSIAFDDILSIEKAAEQ